MPRRTTQPPPHHHPDGGYRNPWETGPERSFLNVFRWMWERWRNGVPPDPTPEDLPRGEARVARPRAVTDEIRVTWVGHATALIQYRGLNVLTDPHWSHRAAPFQWVGPARLAPAGIPFDNLPPIDAVLLSHDHYDHLDDGTVRRLVARQGRSTRWFAPLGYTDWLKRRGVTEVVELDWWQAAELDTPDGAVTLRALPAQHWTDRGLSRQKRLWASWALQDGGEGGVYFGGDTGYFSGFAEIGRQFGPFDVSLLPIGAYDPRWMMERDHMNPEEAVRAYQDLGGKGLFVGIHWGTFRLTDEGPLEPPARAAHAWEAAGLAVGDLWIPRHGETRILKSRS